MKQEVKIGSTFFFQFFYFSLCSYVLKNTNIILYSCIMYFSIIQDKNVNARKIFSLGEKHFMEGCKKPKFSATFLFGMLISRTHEMYTSLCLLVCVHLFADCIVVDLLP
jgi:hypothetical protein